MNAIKNLTCVLIVTCPLVGLAQNGPYIVASKEQLTKYFQGCQQLAEFASQSRSRVNLPEIRGEFESLEAYRKRVEAMDQQSGGEKRNMETRLAEECVRCFNGFGDNAAKPKLDIENGVKTITLLNHIALRIPAKVTNLSRFDPDELTFQYDLLTGFPFIPPTRRGFDAFFIDEQGELNDLDGVALPSLPPLANGFEFPNNERSIVAKNATLFIKRPWPNAMVELKFRTIEEGERYKRSVSEGKEYYGVLCTVLITAGDENLGNGGHLPTSKYGAFVTAVSGHKPKFADASPGSYINFNLEKKRDGAKQLIVKFVPSLAVFKNVEGKKSDFTVTLSP